MAFHKHLPESHSDNRISKSSLLPPQINCIGSLKVYLNFSYLSIFIYPSFCNPLYSVFLIVQFQDSDFHMCTGTNACMNDISSLR